MKELLKTELNLKSKLFIEILFTKKTSWIKQGWNSIYKQSKWKTSWRKSLSFKTNTKTQQKLFQNQYQYQNQAEAGSKTNTNIDTR